VSVVLLEARCAEELTVETWVMSCRVLSRGMEEFVVNELLAVASHRRCRLLVGEYIPTRKNGLVAELYARLGFRKNTGSAGKSIWAIEVADACRHKVPIRGVIDWRRGDGIDA